MRLYDRTNIPLVNKALDGYALRQKITAANIANITTAGYKSQGVSFEELLAKADDGKLLRATSQHPKHFPLGAQATMENAEPVTYELRENRPPGYNEMASGFNDVDIDHEMAELAKNQIRFKFGARIMGEMFKGIQKAIRGTLS
jgi:flagellar basal-body rod protein FlgB